MPIGILKRKVKALGLPLSIALILMRIVIYNKGLIENEIRNVSINYDSYYFVSEEKILKLFFPMSLLYGFLLSEEGTDRFRNVGKELPLLATR